jgi:hypothetical protein
MGIFCLLIADKDQSLHPKEYKAYPPTAEPELMYPEAAAFKSTRPQVQGPRERVLVRGVEAAATLHNTQQDIVTLVSL